MFDGDDGMGLTDYYAVDIENVQNNSVVDIKNVQNDGDVDIENVQNDGDVDIDKIFATLLGSNYWKLVGNLVGSTTNRQSLVKN